METETNLQNPITGSNGVAGPINNREVPDQPQRMIKQSFSTTIMAAAADAATAATNTPTLNNIPLVTETNREVIQPNSPVVPAKISTEHGWQSHGATVRERNSCMYNNDLMSDVTFLVGPKNSAQRIPAHKYVLATGSSVFYAMFFGDLAENSEEIVIPDVEPAAFLSLLRYNNLETIRELVQGHTCK